MRQFQLNDAQGSGSRSRQTFAAARRSEMLPIHRDVIRSDAPSAAKGTKQQSSPLPALPLASWAQSSPQTTAQLLLPVSPTAPLLSPQLTMPGQPALMPAMADLPLFLATTAPAIHPTLPSYFDPALLPMASAAAAAAASVATAVPIESMLAGVSSMDLSPLAATLMPAGFFSYFSSPPPHPGMLEPLHITPSPPVLAPVTAPAEPCPQITQQDPIPQLPPAPAPPSGEPLKLIYLNRDQFIQLQSLIREYGEDWEFLGAAMGIRGRDLANNWVGYSLATEITKVWTYDEMVILYLCRTLNIDCRRTAKIIYTKLPLQCRRKNLTRMISAFGGTGMLPRKRGGRRGNRHPSTSAANNDADALDSEADSEDGSEDDSSDDMCDADAAVEEDTADDDGSPDIKWETGHDRSGFVRDVPMPTASGTRVTHAVEEYYRAHGRVDWAAVSAQTGQSVIACLEQSRFNEGKSLWVYDSESFSWDQANTLHSFVTQHYPAPVPIDFAAVSNLLWVQLPDCIRMFRMLRGEFEWTPDAQRRVSQLTSEGVSSDDIARQLSPTMGGRRVAEIIHSTQVRESPVLRPRVDAASAACIREVVARHFRPELRDVHIILECACRALPMLSRWRVYESALIILSQHPHFAACKGTRRPRAQSARPADERLQKQARTSSAPVRGTRWSEEEVQLLVRYVQSTPTAPNWHYFAAYLGTKTKAQCSTKHQALKKKDRLQRVGAA